MNTTSKENSASLFTIEKVSSAPTALSQLSGCDLCQHCTLLRLLAQSRLDQPVVGEEVMRRKRTTQNENECSEELKRLREAGASPNTSHVRPIGGLRKAGVNPAPTAQAH